MTKFSKEREQLEKDFAKEQEKYENKIVRLKIDNNSLKKRNKELSNALQLAFSLLEENLPNWYLKKHYNVISKVLNS